MSESTSDLLRRLLRTYPIGRRGPVEMTELLTAVNAELAEVRRTFDDMDPGHSVWSGRQIFEADLAAHERRLEAYASAIANSTDEKGLTPQIVGFISGRRERGQIVPDAVMPRHLSAQLTELGAAMDSNTFDRALREALVESPETLGRWIGAGVDHVGGGFLRGLGPVKAILLVGGIGLAVWLYFRGRAPRAVGGES